MTAFEPLKPGQRECDGVAPRYDCYGSGCTCMRFRLQTIKMRVPEGEGNVCECGHGYARHLPHDATWAHWLGQVTGALRAHHDGNVSYDWFHSTMTIYAIAAERRGWDRPPPHHVLGVLEPPPAVRPKLIPRTLPRRR